MSRQTLYTEELADSIVERLEDGDSLIEICLAESMPHRRTVLRWMAANDAFATRCARAREAGAEVDEHKVKTTADGCTEANVQSAKVKISTYQWIAAKKAPKKYGDHNRVELTGKDGGPIETKNANDLTDEQLTAIASSGRPASAEPEKGSD